MFHITGKIYGFDLMDKSLLISIDKSLVKQINEEYFVPFVFSIDKPGLLEVSKQEKENSLSMQEEKYSFTAKLKRSSAAISDLLSVLIGKTAKIKFKSKNTKVGPKINDTEIAEFIIAE